MSQGFNEASLKPFSLAIDGVKVNASDSEKVNLDNSGGMARRGYFHWILVN
jgi:hypothetical protein